MTQPESDRERIDGDIQLTAFFLQAHPDADIEAVLGELVKPLLDRLAAVEADREYNARLVEQAIRERDMYRKWYEGVMGTRMTGPEQQAEKAASAILSLQRAVREVVMDLYAWGAQTDNKSDSNVAEGLAAQLDALLPDPAGTS